MFSADFAACSACSPSVVFFVSRTGFSAAFSIFASWRHSPATTAAIAQLTLPFVTDSNEHPVSSRVLCLQPPHAIVCTKAPGKALETFACKWSHAFSICFKLSNSSEKVWPDVCSECGVHVRPNWDCIHMRARMRTVRAWMLCSPCTRTGCRHWGPPCGPPPPSNPTVGFDIPLGRPEVKHHCKGTWS